MKKKKIFDIFWYAAIFIFLSFLAFIFVADIFKLYLK